MYEPNMIKQNTPEWFAARRGKITASLAAAIVGKSPYHKPDDVMRKMVRDWFNYPDEWGTSPAMSYGIMHEDIAAKKYEEIFKVKLSPGGFFCHENWLGASPDRTIEGVCLVQIKTPYKLRDIEDPEFDDIEDLEHYRIQCNVEMFCSNIFRNILFQWSPYSWQANVIKYDKEYFTPIYNELEYFYEEFQRIITDKTAASIYLEPKEIIIDNDNAVKMAKRYNEISKSIKELEFEKKYIIKELAELSGGKNAIINGMKFTKVKTSRIDVSRLMYELSSEKIEEYRIESEYWRLSSGGKNEL